MMATASRVTVPAAGDVIAIVGGARSISTTLVNVDSFPAASTARTVIVSGPSEAPARAALYAWPITVADAPWTVIVTAVASTTVPETAAGRDGITAPGRGEAMVRAGAVRSTMIGTAVVDRFPAASVATKTMSRWPSAPMGMLALNVPSAATVTV